MKAIDLFCGCGGISSGLSSAGFEVIGGVDIEPKYLQTFAKNFPQTRAIATDLSVEDPIDLLKSFGLKPGQLDLLAGGPPCQGFSKNVPRKHRFLEQENNTLVLVFLNFCEAWRPRFIMMENVAEMKNGFDKAYSEEIIERLQRLGYEVDYTILNSADYGVPQRRRRAFFIAARDGLKPRLPQATHAPERDTAGLFTMLSHVKVWEAIGDLPSISHGCGSDPTDYACKAQNAFQLRLRGSAERVYNHVARRLAPIQFARLSALKPGEGLKQLPQELQVKSGYSGAYGRLTEHMIAPTITRWVFHPGSGRWGHPRDIRVLTIREVARIQGFADHFQFVGSYLQQAGQLGNAVPPMLAEAVAAPLAAQLN